MRLTPIAAAMCGSLLVCAPATAETYNLTLCGASPGGLWSLVGAGVDAAVKAAYPGSTVTYQTSSGGPANIVQVKAKKCQLGFANDGDMVFATAGKAPFKKPVTGFKAIGVMYDWAPIMWIATKDFVDKHQIKDVGDIFRKKLPVRIAFNRKGLLTSAITEATLQAMGVSVKDVISWGGQVEYQASNQQQELMQNRKVDLLANTLFEGHRSIAAMAQSVDLVMLSVPKKAIDATVAEFQLKPWTVKAGTHPWQKNDAHTVTTSIILFADESMPDATAEAITNALIKHPDKMAAVSAAMKKFKPNLMTDQKAAPWHPGAIKAYKAAGLM
ncbi:MAG: TAXI family TRAP transporter solute-binding subunit [Hyphomicrobiaceae bacterium]